MRPREIDQQTGELPDSNAPTRRAALTALLGGAAGLVALAHCAPQRRVVVAPPRPLGAEVGFPVYPMRLSAMDGAHGAVARVDLELRRDGGLYWRGDAAGRLAGARVLDSAGSEVASAAPDGVVTIPRHRRRVQVMSDGALHVDEARIYFDEAGRVVETRAGRPPRWLYMRLADTRPDSLRTGAMLVVVAMLRTRQL